MSQFSEKANSYAYMYNELCLFVMSCHGEVAKSVHVNYTGAIYANVCKSNYQ